MAIPDFSQASREDSGIPCCKAFALNVTLLSLTDDILMSAICALST